jgi:hypothetical protein
VSKQAVQALRCVAVLSLLVFLSACGGSAVSAGDFSGRCPTPPASSGSVVVVGPSGLEAALAHAQPGTTIQLTAGEYGAVVLRSKNSGFVTLSASRGQPAQLSTLDIGGGHWVVSGLVIQGAGLRGGASALPPPGKYPSHPPLVRIQASDVVFERNTIESASGGYPWAAEAPGQADSPPLADGLYSRNSRCVRIVGNVIRNVFNGMQVEGDQKGENGMYIEIKDNKIDDFAGDGIDHSISYSIIDGNIITNGHDICNNLCVHTDGIQGWNFHDQPGIVNIGVNISDNIIIQQARPALAMPADDLHGITIFDGTWKDVSIINNVIITDTWHGITMSGVDGLKVINNTLVGTTSRQTWIAVGANNHGQIKSRNVIIRNNIATNMPARIETADNLEIDHNLSPFEPRKVFVKFDPQTATYDLHLRPGSPARGHGDAHEAPALDIEGAPRGSSVDLGAYVSR